MFIIYLTYFPRLFSTLFFKNLFYIYIIYFFRSYFNFDYNLSVGLILCNLMKISLFVSSNIDFFSLRFLLFSYVNCFFFFRKNYIEFFTGIYSKCCYFNYWLQKDFKFIMNFIHLFYMNDLYYFKKINPLINRNFLFHYEMYY